MKPESLPPGPSSLAEGGDYDGSACRLLVEFGGGREDVHRQCGPDPETGITTVDGEPSEEERRNWVRRTPRYDMRCGGPVDCGHRNARVGHHHVLGVGDHPRSGGVASSVLACVPAQPVVKGGFAAVELFAIVAARVERRRAA